MGQSSVEQGRILLHQNDWGKKHIRKKTTTSKVTIYTPDMQRYLTKLSSSGSSLKKGLPSFSWLRTKFSMSTSKLAEVMQSELSVDCSHFSNSRAKRGNRGCLWRCAHTQGTGKVAELDTNSKDISHFLPSNTAWQTKCVRWYMKTNADRYPSMSKWSEGKLLY